MQLSYHALEQIQARNISESEVLNAITYGARWASRKDSDIKYARLNSIMVVTHKDDWVLTAYKVQKSGTTFNAGKR